MKAEACAFLGGFCNEPPFTFLAKRGMLQFGRSFSELIAECLHGGVHRHISLFRYLVVMLTHGQLQARRVPISLEPQESVSQWNEIIEAFPQFGVCVAARV
jgi:hypothetical protein